MKYFFLAAATLGAAITAAMVITALPREKPSPAVLSSGPTRERLERLSQLVAMKVYVADVLVGEAEGCRGAWLIRGDALLAINLAEARIVERDERGRRAVLRLPPPEVLHPRVDHDKTRTWEVTRTTWIPWRGDQGKLRDLVMREAQKLVAQAAGSPENIEHAQAAAATLLRGFYEEVGWQVQIAWENRASRRP